VSIDQQRIDSARQRVRDKESKDQQLQGRRQSLIEQRERYIVDLQGSGLTPEVLPERIEQSNQAAEAALVELEQTLDSVGA
jgi:hypothetical protein